VRVLLDPAAETELRDAARFYERSREGLGAAYLEAVETAIEEITRHPDLWRRLRGRFRRHLVRSFPYAVIYSVEAGAIYIAAVMHMRRKPGYWEQRQG